MQFDLDSMTLNDLLTLRKYYWNRLQQARDEIEGEYAFIIYSHIQRHINELVNQSSVGTISETSWR